MKQLFRKFPSRSLAIDLIAFIIINACLLTLFIEIEFLEWFYDFSRNHEDWELDEIFSLFLSCSIGLIYFSIRRWRESQSAVNTLQYYLTRDYLTGLYNRRYFDEKLQARTFNADVGVILLDLDNFKKINDEFGHQVGDDVLKRVSRLIEEQLGPRELAARWGGEEFCILTLSSPSTRIIELSEQIRLSLTQDPELIVYNISASIGYGIFPQGSAPNDIFYHVDLALYDAKNTGKNCCRKVRETASSHCSLK